MMSRLNDTKYIWRIMQKRLHTKHPLFELQLSIGYEEAIYEGKYQYQFGTNPPDISYSMSETKAIILNT